jgi:hypothetical protein
VRQKANQAEDLPEDHIPETSEGGLGTTILVLWWNCLVLKIIGLILKEK